MRAFLFYITLFLLILAFSMTCEAYDFDLWARLIAGMGVVDAGHVLKADFLSYTPVHTWWDHEWGAGVIFYLFLKYLGPYSLIILQSIMFFGIFFTASRIIKLRTNITPYNILFYFFALMSVMQNLNNPIRCHMFSFLFFTIFIYIFEKVRKENSYKLLFVIPIITLFWNNIHGGVVAGLGLIAMYAAGEFLNKKPFKKYLITLFASCLVLFINPWGFEYIKFLLMATTMKRPEIVEWWGIFFKLNIFKFLVFKAFMIIISVVELITLKKLDFKNIDKVKYIVLLTTLYLAISHVKLLPFFTIASVCFVYEDFYNLISKIKLPSWKIIYSFVIFLSLFTFCIKDFSVPVGMRILPVKEVEFIKQNNIKGNILTNFGLGSYVAYKTYPDNLIYMDGRYEEVYYGYMLPLLKKFSLVVGEWDEVLKHFPPDIIIFEKTYPIFDKLQEPNSEWQLVYSGKDFAVFLPKKQAIQKFKMPSDDESYYKKTLFDTNISGDKL